MRTRIAGLDAGTSTTYAWHHLVCSLATLRRASGSVFDSICFEKSRQGLDFHEKQGLKQN